MPHVTHNLDGIFEKFERADEHIKNLNDEIAAFIEDNYQIVSKPDADPSTSIISIVGPDPPLRFPVIVGEIVHQLRSSLDHVIWQLVLANGKLPNRNHQFPICDSSEKFEKARKRRNIRGITPAAASLIEESQPYWQIRRGQRLASSKLRILREVNDTDKHRLMMIVVAQTGGEGATRLTIGSGAEGDKSPINIVGLGPPPKGPLQPTSEGAAFLTMQFEEPQPDVEVTGTVPIQIVFGDCGPDLTALNQKPVVHVVQQLRDRVATLVNSLVEQMPAR